MKIKITRPDGMVIEAEGTPAECSEFAQAMAPAPLEPADLTPVVNPGQQVFPWVQPLPCITEPWIQEPWGPITVEPWWPRWPGDVPTYPYVSPYPFTVPQGSPFTTISTGSIRLGSTAQLCGGSVSLCDSTSSSYS